MRTHRPLTLGYNVNVQRLVSNKTKEGTDATGITVLSISTKHENIEFVDHYESRVY